MKIKYITTSIIIAIMSMLFTLQSCSKDNIDAADDKDLNITNDISEHRSSSSSELVPIIKVKRGVKKGEWPNQYCVPPESKFCWLWFQQSARSIINYPYATYTRNTDNTLRLHFDYSKVVGTPEESYWLNDIYNGYVTISDTIFIDNSYFSTSLNKTSIVTILPGEYPILPIAGKHSYSVDVNYY